MDYMIGTIMLWPMNWVPVDWALCNGQTLQVAQYQALYSLLQNNFGGSYPATFALPNLNGRVPIGVEPGVTQFAQVGGTKTNTLTTANIPAHTHVATATTTGMTCSASGNFTIPATATLGNVNTPDSNSSLALSKAGPTAANIYNNNNTVTKEIKMPGGTVTVSGTVGGTVTVTNSIAGNPTPVPVNNMQPYIALNYIICLNGLYPMRP